MKHPFFVSTRAIVPANAAPEDQQRQLVKMSAEAKVVFLAVEVQELQEDVVL